MIREIVIPQNGLSVIRIQNILLNNVVPKIKLVFFFFFDKESTAKQVLSQAVVNQEEKGINYSKGTITSCEVTDSIVLLDLEADLIGW